jgi:predicted DsbA family dithiol-disulfide isomerase
MKVEIWSDIMCPFCFIGKQKFEKALNSLAFSDKIEVVWKSFQLSPSLRTTPGMDAYDLLAEEKGQTREWSINAHKQVEQIGIDAGVYFHFDKTIPANTFQAHRLVHLAQTIGKGSEAEERMFQAFFVNGENIDDVEFLKKVGRELGLSEEQVGLLSDSNMFSDEVERDMYEARQINVRGVPYFVFNDRYAVSGAQEVETFVGVLEKSFQEWLVKNPSSELTIINGQVCRLDGTCD